MAVSFTTTLPRKIVAAARPGNRDSREQTNPYWTEETRDSARGRMSNFGRVMQLLTDVHGRDPRSLTQEPWVWSVRPPGKERTLSVGVGRRTARPQFEQPQVVLTQPVDFARNDMLAQKGEGGFLSFVSLGQPFELRAVPGPQRDER